MRRWALRLVAASLVLVGMLPGAARADGPTVEIDGDTSVATGGAVDIRISGFQTSFVTISTCGNEARRGSVDCNLPSSQGLRLNADGRSVATVVVAKPPMKCPCVIRVASESNDEVASIPLTISDLPTGPVIDPKPIVDAVKLSIRAATATDGFGDWARGALGGPARYAVTVEVTNRTSVTLRNVSLFGSVGRGPADELLALDLPNPGPIAAGATWTQTVYAKVPAPTIGSFRFKVTAAGAGATVDASVTQRHSTPLLLGVLVFLVVDVGLIVVRRLRRRRGARADDQRVAEPLSTTV